MAVITALRTISHAVVLMVVIGATAARGDAAGTLPASVGFLENALIMPHGFLLKAKLDTGADNSSVHAEIIERYTRDGKPWIIFDVESVDGREVRLTLPVFRTTRIKRHAGKPQTRPVVIMIICVGSVKRQVQVNLVDRSRLKYNLLIGRSFMSGYMTVDPAKRFTMEPSCTREPMNP